MIPKNVFKVPALKPRNPHVVASLFRKAGAHEKMSGTTRQKARIALAQGLQGKYWKEWD